MPRKWHRPFQWKKDHRAAQDPSVSIKDGPTPEDLRLACQPQDTTVEGVKSRVDLAVEDTHSSRNLWKEAYGLLEQEDPRLIKRYQDLLVSDEIQGDGVRTKQALSSDKLTDFIDTRLREAENLSKTTELVDAAAKYVLAGKDFIASIASNEPHAAMAWAAIAILLPLLLNPAQQRGDLLSGLEHIAYVIERYKLYLVPVSDADDAGTSTARFMDGIVQMYRYILEFHTRAVCSQSASSVKNYGRDLVKADNWSEILSKINRLDEHCRQLKYAMYNLSVSQGFQRISQRQKSIEQEQCHRAFAFDARTQKDRNPPRVAGTCEWFLDNKTFLSWRDSRSIPLLWVSADPGCGKSVLSRALIDEHLLVTEPSTTRICYYFFKDESDRSSATTAISSLLHQIYTHDSDLIERHALPRWRQLGDRITENFADICEIFKATVTDTSATPTVFVLDAFDECRPGDQKRLVNALEDLFTATSDSGGCLATRSKFLITSRPYPEIELKFKRILGQDVMIALRGDENSERISHEISLVIKYKVPQVIEQLELDDNFVEEAETQLLGKLLATENKTYLWLSLIFDTLEGDNAYSLFSTPESISRFFLQLPTSVDEIYESMLVRSPDPQKAKRILILVIGANRPLSIAEVKTAVSVQERLNTIEDVQLPSDERFEKTARSLCGLLVRSFEGNMYLLHQTVKEFILSGTSENAISGWKHSISTKMANLEIARICVNYLFAREFRNEKLRRQALIEEDGGEKYPLLFYALDEWGIHAKGDAEREARTLISSFLTAMARSPSLLPTSLWDANDMSQSPSTSAVHVIAHFGLNTYLSDVLENTDLNLEDHSFGSKDQSGRTPLMYAAIGGHEQSVEILLTSPSVDINAVDLTCTSSLMYSINSGHDNVVEMLVQRGVNLNLRDEYDRSALHYAAIKGNVTVARLLLERGAAINLTDRHDESPLFTAVRYGNAPLVKLLLEYKADVAPKYSKGRTLLVVAATRREEKIANMLIEYGAEINVEDSRGRSPLSMVAEHGPPSLVKSLLDHEADVTSKDQRGRTPLSWAASSLDSDNGEILKLLLDRGAEVDAKDNEGRTPLSWAADNGTTESDLKRLELLISRGADMGYRDDKGMTPLAYAAWSSTDRKAIIKLLLSHGADINTRADNGSTPLSLAAAVSGPENKAMLEMLIEHGAEVDVKGRKGRTPLALAARSMNGDMDIAELLLCHDAKVDSKDDDEATPLSIAARCGNLAVMQLLLQHGAEVDSRDICDWTPLAWAMRYGDSACIHLLQQHGAKIGLKDVKGRHPLSKQTRFDDGKLETLIER